MLAQTAHFYAAGRCDEHGRGKRFDIGDLWDVMRTLRPTREMVLAAWSHSLEYSIGTSSIGVNVMNAVCEKVGLRVEHLFRRMPRKRVDEMVGGNATDRDPVPCPMWLTEANRMFELTDNRGAYTNSLLLEEERLRDTRLARHEFRRTALDREQSLQPIQTIRAVMAGDPGHRFSNALFPTFTVASLYYAPKTLLMWASGKKVVRDEARVGSHIVHDGMLFKQTQTNGGAAKYDFAWMLLKPPSNSTASSSSGLVWSNVSDGLKGSLTCQLFDMHTAGIADALFMMASSENSRLCPHTQWSGYQYSSEKAFVDQDGAALSPESVYVGLRGIELANGTSHEAHLGSPVDARIAGHQYHRATTKVHDILDRLQQNCRLPALQPLTSSRITKSPPLRKVDSCTIEVNSVVALEHAIMIMEGVLRCSRIPGLTGLQERFANRASSPGCFGNPKQESASNAVDADAGITKVLPYSIDIMQMAWTVDLGSRFYSPSREENLMNFNGRLAYEGLLSSGEFAVEDMPHMSLRYPGFPTQVCEREHALRQISLLPKGSVPNGQAVVDISKANPIQDMPAENLRYETSIALGRPATDAEIEDHRRLLLGSGYVYDVKGDVFDYDTWVNHLAASMLGRGNTDGQVDEDGVYIDTGFEIALDPENMFELRRLELRAERGDDDVQQLNLRPACGSTYDFLKRNPIVVSDRKTGQRKAKHEAPRMPMPATKRLALANLAYKRRQAAELAAASGVSIEVEDGNSHDERF